jgi:predicted DNA-binding ribbon-helix-helix protein
MEAAARVTRERRDKPQESDMKAVVVKRSIILRGRKTSISLEDPFWVELKTIASARALTRAELISTVDQARNEGSNLSSALRCFVLEQYRPRPAAVGATP